MAGVPVFVHSAYLAAPVWLGFILMIDPLNARAGDESILGDWYEGHTGRLVNLLIAGLICGLLWEFWNYWALAKWTYHLPFLGGWENVRYFEMPVIGLIGFIPFGIECWVMWQSMRMPLDGLAEPLPDERSLL